MKLTYHPGRNFGDALNPLVFNTLFPGLFDDDERVLFIGIGSIIGLKKGGATTERRIYFSSGFAAGAANTYGSLPQLTSSDDVVCVRGPLTARALGLPPEKAIADGAILVKALLDLPPVPTTIPFAYMPHVGSFQFFSDWGALLAEADITLIDPREEPLQVLEKIRSCGVLLAEAMHGAILADAMGIPWIPVACYDTINTFKWRDFTASMQLAYEPYRLSPLFDRERVQGMVRAKLGRYGAGFLTAPVAWSVSIGQHLRYREVARAFTRLKGATPLLSDRDLLDDRIAALLGRADHVRRIYG